MKKRLAIFLAVAFGLSWGVLIPAGIVLGTFEHGENSSTVMIGLIALAMFFPLAGALAANAAAGRENRIDLAIRPRIRESARHYLAAWFAPALIALAGAALFFVLFPQQFDPSMRSFIESQAIPAGMSVDEVLAQQPPLIAIIAFAIVLAPFINMIPAFGEELGWRGMLFPSLCEVMSERSAALVSGVIWGFWHAPVIAMGHNYGMGYVGFPIAGILTMVLACTAMACWLSYLRQRSGSVWPCALAHGAFNAAANIGLAFSTSGSTLLGPNPLGLVSCLPLVIVGAICWFKLSAEPQGRSVG